MFEVTEMISRGTDGDGKRYSMQMEIKRKLEDFPGGAVVKNPPANAGDTGSSPGPGRSHMLPSN